MHTNFTKVWPNALKFSRSSLSETENENTENRNRKIILSPKIETKTEKNRKFQKLTVKIKKSLKINSKCL